MFRHRNIEAVRPREAAVLRDGGAVLLDVRETDEWAAGHAPGAVHVPLAEVSAAAGLPVVRDDGTPGTVA